MTLALALASAKVKEATLFLCGGASPLQACMRATRSNKNKTPIASPRPRPPLLPSLVARILYHYEDPNSSLARAVPCSALSLLPIIVPPPPPPPTRLRRLQGTRLPSKKRGRREPNISVVGWRTLLLLLRSSLRKHFLFFGGFRFLGCVFFARFWRAEHVTLIWHQRGGKSKS